MLQGGSAEYGQRPHFYIFFGILLGMYLRTIGFFFTIKEICGKNHIRWSTF